MHKFYQYCVVSLLAVSALVAKEAYTHQQFFPTVVSITTAKVSRVALYNTALVLLLLSWQGLRALFLGELKPREVEKMMEQTFYFVATTCLALTVFREHINATVLGLFVLCLFSKTFHWLAQSRLEYIEQTDFPNDNAKVRECFWLLMLLVALLISDAGTSSYYVTLLLRKGQSVRLLLALEYLVMFVACCTAMARLVLYAFDEALPQRLEDKGKYKFYLEILSELTQCILYIGFFCIILYYYGIPIHLLRELFVALRSFHKTISDFVRYRKLVACLDERYPNATEAEIARDPQCIICYDDMTQNAKKLPCGHIFHKHCLKSWMERNNKCPYCNKQTLLAPPRPAAPAAAPTIPIAAAPVPVADASSSSTNTTTVKRRNPERARAKQQQLDQLKQQQQTLTALMASLSQQPQSRPAPPASAPPPPAAPATAAGTGGQTSPIPHPTSTAQPHFVFLGASRPASSVSAGAQPFPAAMLAGYGQPPDGTPLGQAQQQPAAPATPAQAQAYADFHRSMAAVYSEMAGAVTRIADAYSALAAGLGTADDAPREQGADPAEDPSVPIAPSPHPTPSLDPAISSSEEAGSNGDGTYALAPPGSVAE